MSWIETQEKRTYQTYKARVRAANRLKARGVAWTTALISASTAASIASIASIVEQDLYGEYGSVIAAAISVLTLVASLVVTGVNYEARHRKMFDNYRKIQRLSAELEFLRANSVHQSDEQIRVLLDRYQDLLDESENHSDLDNMAVARIKATAERKAAQSKNDANQKSDAVEKPASPPPRDKHQDRRESLYYYTMIARELVLTFLPYAALGISIIMLMPVLRILF